MAEYNQVTNFRRKDSLPTGDPAKKVTGSELQSEFDAVATAIATKIDSSSLPGTPVVLSTAGSFTAGFGTTGSPVAASSSASINASLSNVFVITFTGAAVTINAPTNPLPGQKMYLKLVNNAAGGVSAFTWNAIYKFRASENVQPTQTNGALDLVVCIYDGTQWLTTFIGKNFL